MKSHVQEQSTAQAQGPAGSWVDQTCLCLQSWRAGHDQRQPQGELGSARWTPVPTAECPAHQAESQYPFWKGVFCWLIKEKLRVLFVNNSAQKLAHGRAWVPGRDSCHACKDRKYILRYLLGTA